MGLSAVVWLTRVRLGGRRIHPGSLGSLWRLFGSSGVFGFTRAGSGVDRRWLGSLAHAVGVDGLIWGGWVHSVVSLQSMGSSGVVVITHMSPGGCWVRPGSFVSVTHSLGVVGFIRGRSINSRAPCRSMGSSGGVGFDRVRSGCR